ncbi:hypothetical protein Ddye_022468 [Dipteronia dyeriana]|uniref:Transposase MuDR plant domain-containing protein n=1 Tax=Dipteronia dyeriana TaxID=168575 RepID=A0AAD9U495_9ROSI|nr:hypothetical protein Ddye_022468 [Dipteronia dyeriana]
MSSDDYSVWVYLPWSMGDNQYLGFSEFEENLFNYESDNEGAESDGGDSEEVIEANIVRTDCGLDNDELGLSDEYDTVGEVIDRRALAVVDEAKNNVNFDLFERCQSKTDDEFFSDSENENHDAKMTRVMKGNPFKKMVGRRIEFKVKNDRDRLTYACKENGCPWRLHTSSLNSDTTMTIKTYKNELTCHMIYKSEEARAKWIASKFQVLKMNNPDIKCEVIFDLLRDLYNVTVDVQRLYKAKKRTLEVLIRDHDECFSYSRGYPIMVQQCNSGSAVYIHLKEDT